MLKKNSIFIKVFIPVIIVILFQTCLIGVVLFVNGTIDSLSDSAINFLYKNGENRSTGLESMMISYWSNLDKLEMDITAEIDGYLTQNGISIDQLRGDSLHEKEILNNMSQSLINALRINASTGVFIYFLDPEGYSERVYNNNGLYYRDFDPFVNSIDNSDILFLRGPIAIARKDKIQLDSLWSEFFTFSPQYEDHWKGFANPQIAAANYPEANPVDLAYWSKPHFSSPGSELDSNKCITYTRPLFYGGELIAIIGSEVQTARLEKYLPSADFDSHSRFGYMLFGYDTAKKSDDGIDCDVYQVTGSYIKRIISAEAETELALTLSSYDNVYALADKKAEKVKIVYHPLRLYNTNAPFSNEQWALAAVGTDNMVFALSRNLAVGIVYSSVIVFIIGSIFLVFSIRTSTKPLVAIAKQIEDSEQGAPIIGIKSNTYEIVLLCSTINAMREKRDIAEAELRKERERYLTALESAADTFMEYDIEKDNFMLYYFSGDGEDNGGEQLNSKTIPDFVNFVLSGGFCHPDDVQNLIEFLHSESMESLEVRAKTSVFSHIESEEVDGEYYWFLLKVSRIGGKASVIIGTAKDITREKLAEYANIESSHRDPTTGLYNRSYGVQIADKYLKSAVSKNIPFAVVVIRIDNFDHLEAFYGRVFGGIVLMEFSHALHLTTGEKDIAIRMSNDEFMILFCDTDIAVTEADVRIKAKAIETAVAELYTGENAELLLGVSIGAVTSGSNIETAFQNAHYAALYASRNDMSYVYYDEIPQKELEEEFSHRETAVSIYLDITKDNMVVTAFELFERTSDFHSAVKILLRMIGEKFAFDRVIICSFDTGFGTNQVVYQWNIKGTASCSDHIYKISHNDLNVFESLLDENSTMRYSGEVVKNCGEGVGKLLCLIPGEAVNAYCCTMYENGVQTGRVLFISKNPDRGWTDTETYDLYETTKIIAAHMSIEKSNSASRAKSEFLSRISHEIRTPMNAIIGMSDIAINSMNNPERLLDSIQKIDFSARHLLALINDVLEMSRIESGKLQIESTAFDLNRFIAGVETLMRMPIEKREIKFEVESSFRHNMVIGDEYRLRQVLVNLLGNANKFTESGGIITLSIVEIVELEDSGDSEYGLFKFAVKDTGIGISTEDQPLVFKAFEQASSSAKRQGTGLGLAISGNIINAMNSKIELNSKLGVGSEFHFTVKLKLDAGKSGIAGEVSEENQEIEAIDYTGYFKGKRALLVDDIDINIEIAVFILEDIGLEIETAVNGQEAVDKFFASDVGYYDVILMDIQMPVMDGLTATRKIRENVIRADARTVPIIAMTANAFDEDMKKSIESGMNGHVAKPIETEKLFGLLEQVLHGD